jgi:PmbA protein
VEKLKEKIKAALAKRKLAADVYIEEKIRTEVQANDGEVEKITRADSFGACIRVFKGGKMGAAYFTAKDAAIAEKMIDKACDGALIQGYEGYKMPVAGKCADIKLADRNFPGISLEHLKESALLLEKTAKSSPKVKFSRDTAVSSNLTRVNFMNTSGADCYYEKTFFHAYTSAIAIDGSGQEVVDAAGAGVNFTDINIEELGKDCSDRTAGLLGGGPVKSGRYRIILPPYAASDMLVLLSSLFLAGNIRKGRSLLAGFKKGDEVGSKILNIRDDALMDYGAGSYPVDGEGSAGEDKAVLENGKLNTFLYDIINAEHFRAGTTGNSVRHDFKGLPECGVSNFYIKPGSGSCGGETGILVNSLMGLHMTDTVSGNFSLGINGWLMESGEKKQAVKETLMTGNIRDLLLKISKVCNDLKFYGDFGSPTLVADEIEVAGK